MGCIGLLDKNKVQAAPEEPFAIGFNLKPPVSTHARTVLGHHKCIKLFRLRSESQCATQKA